MGEHSGSGRRKIMPSIKLVYYSLKFSQGKSKRFVCKKMEAGVYGGREIRKGVTRGEPINEQAVTGGAQDRAHRFHRVDRDVGVRRPYSLLPDGGKESADLKVGHYKGVQPDKLTVRNRGASHV